MIKFLEKQVSQQECKSQVDFLSACQAAPNASPTELRGGLVASYHMLMGQAPMSYPFTLLQGASPVEQLSAPAAPPLPVPECSPGSKTTLLPRPCWQLLVELCPRQHQKGPLAPNSEWFHLGIRYSSRATQKEARKEYFKRHSYNFTTEGMHDLSEVFRHKAESAKLLGSSIYEIQEVWKGPDELWQANYTLRSLPKGLKLLHVVGIHDPDTLCHFSGLTHCPWCGKEGQNKGTVVNHLWTVHYRLSLVYDKCYNYPSTSSDTLCHHTQQNCPPSGEGDPDESVLSE